VFVGLTNLRPAILDDPDPAAPAAAKPGLRSRGEVVMAALGAGSAVEAAETLGELEIGAYNAFQLLVADEREASLTVYRERPEIIALQPGVHVIGNVDDRSGMGPGRPDMGQETATREPRVRKLSRVRERVEKLRMQTDQDLFEGLAGICREHVVGVGFDVRGQGLESTSAATHFESTCVHAGEAYGTRSSLLLELAEDRERSRLWGTDGPPCERPYEDLSPLLWALDVRSGPAAEAEHETRTKR
jgi:uncharacterized protein with NRDE domain